MTTIAVEKALRATVGEIGPALLAAPEDQWFDRKSARVSPQTLAKTLISLANAEGGVVVVGLHDGTVEGTDGSPEKRNSQMQAHIDFCHPPVRVRQRLVGVAVGGTGESRDHVLVIDVEPGEVVHSNQKDDVFLRVGDEDRRLTFTQRQELLYDKGQASFEAVVVQDAGTDDLDMPLFRSYAEAVGAPEPARLLDARGLLRKGQLTIAGCLLFARNPQSHLPQAVLRILRYRGRERGSGAGQQLIDDVKVEGPIPQQLLEAREITSRLQPVRRALVEGRFADVPLVPEDAWLEGIVNAVVHRSYSNAGDHIRVEVFDDRIEIHSPGRFPGLVNLDDPLNATRFARNPRIARVCADLHFGQELGEGIRRIFEEMRHAGLTDPVYTQTSGSAVLKLFTEPVDRRLDERLSDHGRAITAALRDAGRLSTGELVEAVGASRPTIRKQLEFLREAGIVEWVGKSANDPRASWQLARR